MATDPTQSLANTRKALVAALDFFDKTPIRRDVERLVNAARAYLRATEGDGDAKLREAMNLLREAVLGSPYWQERDEWAKRRDRLLASPAPEAGEKPTPPSPEPAPLGDALDFGLRYQPKADKEPEPAPLCEEAREGGSNGSQA